ncbi:MAG TPA: endolytic transglycosylase MltG [Candidatus Nitrosotenuis sp.]|nr:endolytic transglycosylase MltG [Candidatus Nitrosotenuis sp.]
MLENHLLLTRLRRRRTYIAISLVAVLTLLVAVIGAYQWSLTAINKSSTDEVRVVIESGDSARMIADKLYGADLIKSKFSFHVYTELTRTRDNLQAGGYTLSQSLSVADIVDHMSTGRSDEFDVSIIPGLTLKQQYDDELEGSFAEQGFSADEISRALGATYDSPLFAQKPAGTSLEGYIYPDTYRIAANGDLSTVLDKSFEEFYRVIQENNIEQALAQKQLTLHEGLTLASIVQKEVSDEQDQRQVAQVFYSRIADDIALGSDVTFLYAAELMGVEPKIGLDSPYNTRKYKGLPPGPIANFNLSALKAVADPAPGEFLYFVADPEGNTYYARTLEEHEANVERYNRGSRSEFSY